MRRVAGRYLFVGLLACAAMAISGCGTGNADGPGADGNRDPGAAGNRDPGAATTSPEALMAADATERVCGILAACCADAAFPYDEQGCRALNRDRIFQHFQAQSFFGAELDTEVAQRCLDSIGQVSEGCPGDRPGGNLTDACDRVFKGSVPLGGTCDASHGCATTPENPRACDRAYDVQTDKYAKSGVCVAIPPRVFVHGKLGEACSNTCLGDDQDLCTHNGAPDTGPEGTCYTGDGLICSFESHQCEAQAVRAPLLPLGAPCSAWAECADNNYCTSGTCQLPPRATVELCMGKIPPPPMN